MRHRGTDTGCNNRRERFFFRSGKQHIAFQPGCQFFFRHSRLDIRQKVGECLVGNGTGFPCSRQFERFFDSTQDVEVVPFKVTFCLLCNLFKHHMSQKIAFIYDSPGTAFIQAPGYAFCQPALVIPDGIPGAGLTRCLFRIPRIGPENGRRAGHDQRTFSTGKATEVPKILWLHNDDTVCRMFLKELAQPVYSFSNHAIT